MNIPGMPAGMGARRSASARATTRSAARQSDKDQKDCKVTDKKQTANRLTVTMTCKQGTMTIDQQYNAARTEFKGTMKMNSQGRRHDHEHHRPQGRRLQRAAGGQGARREDRPR